MCPIADKAIRFIALGRDATSIAHGEDNEPTGIYVSNGSSQKDGLLGTEDSLDEAREFFTQQHGDDNAYEFFRARRERRESFAPVIVQ